jgi:hypothetical protein
MFLSRNTLVFIVWAFFSFMCRGSKKVITENVNINKKELDSVMSIHGEKIAILSCLRCHCFVEDFNLRYYKSGKKPEGYILLTDTTCNKLLFSATHISNDIIERISEDIYNLTLLKKSGAHIKIKIVSVEDSRNADKVAESFFKPN